MLENREGTFVGMPCGLFSRDIGAKNARKIVFIASTRKSDFAGADLAIGGSIAQRHAQPVCAILSVRGFRDFRPYLMPKRAKTETQQVAASASGGLRRAVQAGVASLKAEPAPARS